MLPILLMLADAPAQEPLPRQWAQFSRAGALSHVRETVDIATGDAQRGAPFPYRLRFTRTVLNGQPEVRWADSATCPAVRGVMMSMQRLKMPSPAPYGLDDGDITVTADGTRYRLTAPSSDNMGELTISSNVRTPLAAWVDAAFKELSPCWQPGAT